MAKRIGKISDYIKRASFSDHESKIIEYVINNDYGSIMSFSRYLGIARASIYKLADSLFKKGVLDLRKKGKRTIFVLNNDFNLLKIYKDVYEKLEKTKKIRSTIKQNYFPLPKNRRGVIFH